MVDPEQYITQGLKIVEALTAQGNLQSALSACEELLKINPYHRKVQKKLDEIQNAIVRKNEEKVDSDIAATMHLWKEGRLEELRRIYGRLFQFAPDHGKLRGLIEKLNAQLMQKQSRERGDFISSALAAIKKLLDEKRFGDTIQACNELLGVDPLNERAGELLAQAKKLLVEQKLQENQRVIEGADFQRAIELYQTLLSIDSKNEAVKRLMLTAQTHLASQNVLSSKIHLNESIERMKQLFKNAEYEKVLQMCEEIDRLNPGNFTARTFKKKARATIEREINEKTVEILKKNLAEKKAEFAKNPGAFAKI